MVKSVAVLRRYLSICLMAGKARIRGSKEGGSGLGLAIVHSLVTNRFQGHVRIDTAPGQGATFVVRLPLPTDALRRSETIGEES